MPRRRPGQTRLAVLPRPGRVGTLSRVWAGRCHHRGRRRPAISTHRGQVRRTVHGTGHSGVCRGRRLTAAIRGTRPAPGPDRPRALRTVRVRRHGRRPMHHRRGPVPAAVDVPGRPPGLAELAGALRVHVADFRPGDVAVVWPVATADLGVGQVLLVDDPDRPRELRLHRLADVLDRRLVLQGDANPQADSTRVDPARVHGVVALRVPVVGRPAVWAAEGRHAAVAAAAVLVLLLLAAAGWHRPENGAERSNVDDGTASEQRLRCSREKPDRVTQHCARQDRRIAKSTI